MDFENEDHAVSLLEELFRQQRCKKHLCDVTLRAGGDKIYAHACVLAASSDYFRALLSGDFEDCHKRECDIPRSSSAIVNKVVVYMYTGKISITTNDVEDILSLADYLCIDNLKRFCALFLRENLTTDNCLFIKLLADKFSLQEVCKDAEKFIAPRFADLLLTEEALDLPAEYVVHLLKDSRFNYIREQDLIEFVIRWIDQEREDRIKYFSKLFQCIEPTYLSRTFLKSFLTEQTIVTAGLGDECCKVIREAISEDAARSKEEVIVCRSRSVNMGEEVKLLCYVIYDEAWVELSNPEPHVFDGLESLLHHKDAIWFLVSKTEDMYGYMHHTEEKKYFWKFDLKAGTWHQVAAPIKVRGGCRMVSHINGIYVIDKNGIIEQYNCEKNEWMSSIEGRLFDNPNITWYVLPMPVDRYIYFLRAFSAGYAFSYSQLSLKLYRYDTVERNFEPISAIEAGEVDLEDHERIHGYTWRPGKLTFKNELGESRLRFHFVDETWSTRKTRVILPKFVKEVWGCAEWQDRVYFAGKTTADEPIFMFYDYSRNRFKATAQPQSFVSGLLCHVRISKEMLERLQEAPPSPAEKKEPEEAEESEDSQISGDS